MTAVYGLGPRPVAEAIHGTTVVRAARPEVELIEVTALGDTAPVYLERWRGWTVECWSDWLWTDPVPPTEDPR